MTLQAVRSYYEAPIIQVFSDAGVKLILDNAFYDENDADTEFGVLYLSFTQTTEQAISCVPEHLRGLLVLEIFTPKGIGPGRAQRILTDCMKALQLLNQPQPGTDEVKGTVGVVTGPSFRRLEKRPYFAGRLSVPFQARYEPALVP